MQELGKLLLVAVIVPIGVQVITQLANYWIEEQTQKSKFTIRLG
jgi:hypothetical protein